MYQVNVFLKQSLHNFCWHVVFIYFAPTDRIYPVKNAHLSTYPAYNNIWLDNVTVDIGCATILHYSIDTLILH